MEKCFRCIRTHASTTLKCLRQKWDLSPTYYIYEVQVFFTAPYGTSFVVSGAKDMRWVYSVLKEEPTRKNDGWPTSPCCARTIVTGCIPFIRSAPPRRKRRRRGKCRRAGAEQEGRERRGETRHFPCPLYLDRHPRCPSTWGATDTGSHKDTLRYRYGTYVYPPIPTVYERAGYMGLLWALLSAQNIYGKLSAPVTSSENFCNICF